MNKIVYLLFLLLVSNVGIGQEILSLKDRAKVIDDIQKDRLDNLLPKLMEDTDIDLWVLITREYNEDPIIKTMLPPTWLNARRQTILVFSKNKTNGGVSSAAITRYPFGKLIPSIWNKEEQPNQWQALADYIVSKELKNMLVFHHSRGLQGTPLHVNLSGARTGKHGMRSPSWTDTRFNSER